MSIAITPGDRIYGEAQFHLRIQVATIWQYEGLQNANPTNVTMIMTITLEREDHWITTRGCDRT